MNLWGNTGINIAISIEIKLLMNPNYSKLLDKELEKISRNSRFVFAAVKGDYGDKLLASLDRIIVISVPKEVRSRRVRERSFSKFGERILPGGDLYEKETAWFSLTDSRPEDYTEKWLKTVNCPVIRIDGTLPVRQNVDYLVSVLAD